MPNTKVHTGSPRLAELDGLRALAVISVILFHCDITGLMNAGFFGVDMFFTISGFIITAILLKEYHSAGNFNFPNFYFRRLKRLLPPMLGLIVVAFLSTWAISIDAFRHVVADAPAALFYLSNWRQIFQGQNYFDTTPHVLRHLWSLAVEEQFYFFWPPVAYATLKRAGPKAAGALALVLSVLSTAWMWRLYELNLNAADQNRIYLGADTHAMGLLMGAALACFWNPLLPRAEKDGSRLFWRAAALLACALLGAMATCMNTSDPALYRGAFLVVPILTCTLAYATMGDRSFFISSILRTRIVQWFGLRSYSLYLVHWLVFVSVRLVGFKDFSAWRVLLPVLALVLILSELMYRTVELPSMRFDLNHPGVWPKLRFIASYAIIAAVFSAAITLVGVEPQVELARAAPNPSFAVQDRPGAEAPTQEATLVATSDMDAASGDLVDATVRITGGENIYAIGDSVLLGTKMSLTKIIPGIQIDAQVGRQASQGLAVVKERRARLGTASTVLVHLGTNGYINEAQFRELLTELAGCKSVILINVHADRRWTTPNNEIIERMTHEFPNTHLIDWSRISARRPDYFVKDGIHLTTRGILAFASQIRLATGGAPLPDLQQDTVHAAAHPGRLAPKPAGAPPLPAVTPAPAAATDAPASPELPTSSRDHVPGEAEQAPLPAPVKDAQAE